MSDAVAIGLGSMIGAGAFAVWQPAISSAGSGVLIGLVLAAAVAFCNATSTAQLAAVHPVAGGAYAYGNAELGAWWGYLAGWSFVIGKTASCAAMAMVFAAYAAPGFERPAAIAAVIALTIVNLVGVTRTALATKIIVVLVLASLAFVGTAGLISADEPARILGDGILAHGGYGILQSAGLIFFAFAGYARIATMGEEVRDPEATIPRAIVAALAVAVVVYAVLALTVLRAMGADAWLSEAPLSDVVEASGWAWGVPIVRVGAACAALGALLALIAGVGRTAVAMARGGDLPGWAARIHEASRVPRRAQVAVAVVVIGILLFVDLRGAIGFSSFGVLVYYLVANLAALRQRSSVRRYPRWLQVAGAGGCLILAATLPWQSLVAGVAVISVGVAIRGVRLLVERRAV